VPELAAPIPFFHKVVIIEISSLQLSIVIYKNAKKIGLKNALFGPIFA